MKKEKIDRLIKITTNRAITETVVAIGLIGWLGNNISRWECNNYAIYGYMMVIGSCGLIMGILWNYTITPNTLKNHPETDGNFWKETFESQAKLLRFISFWYVCPLFIGISMMFMSELQRSNVSFYSGLAFLSFSFTAITLINQYFAQCLYKDSFLFTE